MAYIKPKIEAIRTAQYGKDVRESIASGLEEINKETESTTTLASNKVNEMDELKKTLEVEEGNRQIAEESRQTNTQTALTSINNVINKVEQKLQNGEFIGQTGLQGPKGEKGDKGDPGSVENVTAIDIKTNDNSNVQTKLSDIENSIQTKADYLKIIDNILTLNSESKGLLSSVELPKINTMIVDGNFNNIVTPGFYTIYGSSIKNAPESGNNWGLLVLKSGINNSDFQQIATKNGTDKIFIRHGINSIWKDYGASTEQAFMQVGYEGTLFLNAKTWYTLPTNKLWQSYGKGFIRGANYIQIDTSENKMTYVKVTGTIFFNSESGFADQAVFITKNSTAATDINHPSVVNHGLNTVNTYQGTVTLIETLVPVVNGDKFYIRANGGGKAWTLDPARFRFTVEKYA